MSVIACLDAPVGPGIGQPHDIALVQALLGQICDPAGHAYWAGPVDGLATDELADVISRFQEDFDLLEESLGDIRAMIDPASVTFQCLREAAPPALAGLRAVAGTATLYIPPRGGMRVLCALTAKLRTLGFAGDMALGRNLAVLAERVFDRHRFVVRFPAPQRDRPVPAHPERVRVHLHGLKWMNTDGRLTSSEVAGESIPGPILTLISTEAGRFAELVPEQFEIAGRHELWLRHDGR
ncbi:hypothetical protein [Nisaea sediminum]|uniref:hypothetical protein n=1 Tax=Nisaea sediminum TaxID=2775867 RepID=UPI0018694725|nr:hypothetical protein [Nisaea sediminum]